MSKVLRNLREKNENANAATERTEETKTFLPRMNTNLHKETAVVFLCRFVDKQFFWRPCALVAEKAFLCVLWLVFDNTQK